MTIPIIGEIWDGIRWIIDTIMDKVPAPIKFFFFLFFILIFGTLISSFIHLTGIHCNSDSVVMKMSPLSFIENSYMIFIDINQLNNKTAYIPDTLSPFDTCVWDLCNVDNKNYLGSSDTCINETKTYYLQSTLDMFMCVVCEKEAIYVENYDRLSNVCIGNVTKIPYLEMGWWQKSYCDEIGNCMPPPSFEFDSTTGLFTCSDESICGDNISGFEPVYEIDERLDMYGAVPFYPNNIADIDYRRAVSIDCDKEARPVLKFFKIELFNYKIWLLIMILYILIVVMFKLKG